jgi:hypothetical protein
MAHNIDKSAKLRSHPQLGLDGNRSSTLNASLQLLLSVDVESAVFVESAASPDSDPPGTTVATQPTLQWWWRDLWRDISYSEGSAVQS